MRDPLLKPQIVTIYSEQLCSGSVHQPMISTINNFRKCHPQKNEEQRVPGCESID